MTWFTWYYTCIYVNTEFTSIMKCCNSLYVKMAKVSVENENERHLKPTFSV